MSDAINPVDQILLLQKVSKLFSPSAPVNRRDLFAGRLDQLRQVFRTTETRGQHAVIFGERGVGKTSLANIVKEMSETDPKDGLTAIKVNCSKGDGFSSVWKKALDEIHVPDNIDAGRLGYVDTRGQETHPLSEELPADPQPNDIRRALESVGPSIIIFDEFDRVTSGQSLFADTIKTLSDSSTHCTMVLVGVAQNIDELIAEHASVDRALVQIQMPRMTPRELHEIITKAMNDLDMTMSNEAREMVVLLSQGLPHYTHVLGEASTTQAIERHSRAIDVDDVKKSITKAVSNTQQSIRNAYQKATTSPRKDTLFKDVLLACALAEVDQLGYFASSDVRQPLRLITGRQYEIPNFSQHLDKFSSEDRGKVLEKAGKTRRFRFRFKNPLLQPFVIMCGIADKTINDAQYDLLKQRSATAHQA